MKLLITAILHLSTFLALGQWQQSAGTAGLNMQALLSYDNYNFAGGQTGAYLSTDGAANFLQANTGNDNVGPTRCFTKDANYLYTCTSQGAYRSADNGATWVSKSVGLTNLLGSGILNVGLKLFYVGPNGVFSSTDQGELWSAAGLTNIDVRCITAINDTLFVGTNGAGIYKSTDWGANWVQINNGLGGATNFRAIESKGNTLFAGGQIGTGVYRSTNFGASWTLLAGGLATGSYRGFASNSQFIVAGSFGAGVFYSTNNGDNWTAINSGLTDLTIFDLEFNDNYLMAATNNQGVFRLALSNLSSTSGFNGIYLKEGLFIFPNPTSNCINLKSDVLLIGTPYTIADISGKTLFSGVFNSDNTSVDLVNWPSGNYLLGVGECPKQLYKVVKQ